MTKYIGQLYKMTTAHHDPVQYNFVLKQAGEPLQDLPPVNHILGASVTLEFTGKINCINCQRSISKTYNQGYCFPCMQKLAACDLCVVKPHTCHFDQGTCREPTWAQAHCFSPHVVYLASSSGIKVGITRETQLKTRWIDQGAVQTLQILRVKSRYQAGLIEHAFAQHVQDKTDWRKMLQGCNFSENLSAKRDELFSMLAIKIQEIASRFAFGDIEILTSESVNTFKYPILEYPSKVAALAFEKTPKIQDKLLGIKGQYLIFPSGVINLRKYTGFEVAIEF